MIHVEPIDECGYLYVQHGCEVCAEAAAELQAAELPFLTFYVTAAPEPDLAIVWNPDGTEEKVERHHFQGFPMFVDRAKGLKFIGLPAIRQRLDLLP